MTNHLRVLLPALLAFATTGCSPAADDSAATAALGNKSTPSINGSNIPAEPQIRDGVGHMFSLSAGSLHENGRHVKQLSNVSFVLFFDGVVYVQSAAGWSSLDNGSWVSASDPRKPSANDSALPPAKALVDAKLDVWALSGGVVYENGAKAGYSANVISLVYAGGVIYQENSAEDWWLWNGTTWVASSAPTLSGGGGGEPDAGGAVDGGVSPPATAPTVKLTASASSVTSGGSATLTWSSTNATSCTSSGAWSGTRPTSGSTSTGALTAAATFDLSCTGAGGSAKASATVSVSTGTTPPPAGTSWVYYDGKYDWTGDWDSNLTANYDAKPTGFSCLTGADCIEFTPSSEWAIWIPFAQTSNNPNDTLHTPGIGINIDGFNYLTIAINPTKAGFAPTFYIDYSLPGQVDLGAGNCVSIAGGTDCASGNYGPNPMVAGQWNVYNIPISAFNIGSILSETKGWIYKFALQEHGDDADQTFYVDQVGFTVSPLTN